MSKRPDVRHVGLSEDFLGRRESFGALYAPTTLSEDPRDGSRLPQSPPIRARTRHAVSPLRRTSETSSRTTATIVDNTFNFPSSYDLTTASVGARSGVSVGRQSESRLSAAAEDFLRQAPFRNVRAASRHVIGNPSILHERGLWRSFVLEAVNANSSNDTVRARSCVEKSVMVTHCAELTRAEIRSFFEKLLDADTISIRKFDKDFQRLWTFVQNQCRSPDSTLSSRGEQRRPLDLEDLSDQLERLDTGSRMDRAGLSRHSQQSRHGSPTEDPAARQGGYGEGLRHEDARHRPTDSPERYNLQRHAAESHKSLASDVSRPSFQGTQGEEERLDPRYYKRSPQDAGRLLKVGRVFAILRHSEFAGGEIGQLKWKQKTKQGVEIYTHICRMVVVKECHGFVWAIQINTYSGHGVSKRGFNQEDIDAHAVIHMEKERPRAIANEPRMKKTPIKVIPSGRESLDAASRINFSKPHSIDHNVKFLDIGKVAPESMPYLTTYWKQYL